MMTTQPDVQHNEAANRFETTVDGHRAVAEYQRQNGVIRFTHTHVPEALEGRGIGSALARTGLDFARTNNLAVVPQCQFIAGYIQRHPEYQDLVQS